MEIKDIIRDDADRLFILDPECYIIFTGDDPDDDRPFIRIGNWIDLPVDIIPLIENIIVTDDITGNPSLEQFNIDITCLDGNRYIGSEGILNRYLDFQKIFALDLTNASIVKVEKDIPELSQKKSISGKNQFVGVFYRNGNFRTVHNETGIINLHETAQSSPVGNGVYERIRVSSRTARYRGTGLVILSRNPMFYSEGCFIPYLMSMTQMEELEQLRIDPSAIGQLIFPSSNYLAPTPFLKWLNGRQGKLTVFSDRPDDWSRIHDLFPRTGITLSPFDGMKTTVTPSLTMENIPGTFSLRLTLADPSGETLHLAFLKGPAHGREILKEKLDGILVPYSAFEDMTLLFKSTETPLAVIDDGNPRISRMPSMDHVILYPGIQYDITGPRDLSFLSGIPLPPGFVPASFEKQDIPGVRSWVAASHEGENGDENRVLLFNLQSLARLYLFSTTDRAFAGELRSLYQDLSAGIRPADIRRMGNDHRVILVFMNRAIVQFLVPLSPADRHVPPSEADGRDRSFHERVERDRERLRALLDILLAGKIHQAGAGRREDLRRAIMERKATYSGEWNAGYTGEVHGRPSSGEGVDSSTGTGHGLAGHAGGSGPAATGEYGAGEITDHVSRIGKGPSPLPALKAMKNRMEAIHPRLPLISAILLLGLLLAGGVSLLLRPHLAVNGTKGHDNTAVQEIQKAEDRRIVDKYAITVTDTDIYEYANQVAVKNGYSPISMQELKSRNPNWIYPGNVFILIDGEKIVVNKGDTLWDLAHEKLLRVNIEFFRIIEKLEKSDPAMKGSILQEAEKYALTARNRQTLADEKRKLTIGPR